MSHPLRVSGLLEFKDSFESVVEMIDDYKNVITPGLHYIEGRFKKLMFQPKGFLLSMNSMLK